jgi:hypothetical protein
MPTLPLRFAGADPDLIAASYVEVVEVGGAPLVSMVWLQKLKHPPRESSLKVVAMKDMLRCADIGDGVTAAAVESQNVSYTGKSNAARPQDQIYLAQVAGQLQMCMATDHTFVPLPAEWKGSMKGKWIHQRRLMKRLGWHFEKMGGQDPYPVPLDYKELCPASNKGDWKDINDSVGLALYAYDRWVREVRKKR